MAMATPTDNANHERDTRCAAAIRYAIEGELRFLSHHDEIRLLVRALRRAGWPLAYSAGFNPQPRITLALPRSVGIASDCQLAVAQLREESPQQTLHARLAAALPNGCRLLQVQSVPRKQKPHATAAVYAVPLEPAAASDLPARMAAAMRAETVIVERIGKPGVPARTIDIRPFIEELELKEGELRMHLRIAQQQSARPIEILTTLDLPLEAYAHRVRRAQVTWDTELPSPAGRPAAVERNEVDQETNDDAQAKDNAAQEGNR